MEHDETQVGCAARRFFMGWIITEKLQDLIWKSANRFVEKRRIPILTRINR